MIETITVPSVPYIKLALAADIIEDNSFIYDETNKILYIKSDNALYPIESIVDDALSTTSENPVQNKVINAAINSEIEARQTADTTLQSNIDTVSTALTTESTRAAAAELVNSNAVTAETNRAKAAESTNATAISTETTRAKSAESTLTTNLATETTNRETADSTLTTNLTAETTRAKAAEGVNATAISTETANRQNADATIQSQIDAMSLASDVVDIIGTYSELSSYDTSSLTDNDIIKVLQDENKDNSLSYYKYSISTKTFTYVGSEGPYYTKSESDTLLNAKATVVDLAAETTRATTAESANTTLITTETSDRKTADSTLQDNIDVVSTSLATETTRATNAEGVNAASISTEATSRADADTALTTSIENEATARETNDTTLQSNIDAEAETARAAEQALQDNIDTLSIDGVTAEATRAKAVEATLQDNIDAEAATARVAEETNANNSFKIKVDSSDATSDYAVNKIVAATGGGIIIKNVTDSTTGEKTMQLSYSPADYYAEAIESFPEAFVNNDTCGPQGSAIFSVYNATAAFKFRSESYIEVKLSSHQAISTGATLSAAIYKYVDGTMTRVIATTALSIAVADENTNVKMYFDMDTLSSELTKLESGCQYYVAINTNTQTNGTMSNYIGIYGISLSSGLSSGTIFPNFTFYNNNVDITSVTSFETSSYSLAPIAKTAHYNIVY